MAMTKEECDAKDAILDILYEDGYGPYAKLVELCDINLTRDPKCIAYMIPGKATIVVNAGLNIDLVSAIIRHEILHYFLKHQIRALKYFGIDPDSVNVDDVKSILDGGDVQGDIDREYAKAVGNRHELVNIAGDYEISNKGYTQKDKSLLRRLRLNDVVIGSGLITDFDHPDWVDLSFEELLDRLQQELPPLPPQPPVGPGGDPGPEGDDKGDPIGPGGDPGPDGPDGPDGPGGDPGKEKQYDPEYIEGWNQAVADYQAGRLKI